MIEHQDVYVTKERFEKDLEFCLTIIDYPNKKNKFYLCEYIDAGLHKKIVRVVLIDDKKF